VGRARFPSTTAATTSGSCRPTARASPALQILNILEGFDIAAPGFGSADYVHLFVEAKKLAFEDRARFYADPASPTSRSSAC
jgi:gamma-glutamyltranspeptidase